MINQYLILRGNKHDHCRMNIYRNPIGKNRELSLVGKLPTQHPVAAKRVIWPWMLLSVQGMSRIFGVLLFILLVACFL
jgi:hypothetical protein